MAVDDTLTQDDRSIFAVAGNLSNIVVPVGNKLMHSLENTTYVLFKQ